MIRFTVYGVIAEKPRVDAKVFRAPCTKNYALDRKTIATFLMATTSSITMQSLGKIAQCAQAVGAKMWCFYRQDAAKRQTAGIKFTHRPQIRFFAPHRFTSNLAGPTDTWIRLPAQNCTSIATWGGNTAPIYHKFPLSLFGKESPRRGDSLDRFRRVLGAFICLTILH